MEKGGGVKYKVAINLYDLSQGMARQLSQQFLGRQIAGIWHTGICVYQREYFFGGGLFDAPIGQTQFGRPQETIELGETEIKKDVFETFLNGLRGGKYQMQSYHILDNNCNNFTNDCAHFLLGKGIPDYIISLPSEFLATPLGQMMRPMIDSFFQNMNPMNNYNNSSNIVNNNININPLPAPVVPVNNPGVNVINNTNQDQIIQGILSGDSATRIKSATIAWNLVSQRKVDEEKMLEIVVAVVERLKLANGTDEEHWRMMMCLEKLIESSEENKEIVQSMGVDWTKFSSSSLEKLRNVTKNVEIKLGNV